MKIRFNDIRLLSSAPILYNVAKEYLVPGDIMLMILLSLHSELGALYSDTSKQEKLRRENPELPTAFKKDLLNPRYISKALDYGLLKKVNDNYSLTNKAIAVLNKTSELQKEMDEK